MSSSDFEALIIKKLKIFDCVTHLLFCTHLSRLVRDSDSTTAIHVWQLTAFFSFSRRFERGEIEDVLVNFQTFRTINVVLMQDLGNRFRNDRSIITGDFDKDFQRFIAMIKSTREKYRVKLPKEVTETHLREIFCDLLSPSSSPAECADNEMENDDEMANKTVQVDMTSSSFDSHGSGTSAHVFSTSSAAATSSNDQFLKIKGEVQMAEHRKSIYESVTFDESGTGPTANLHSVENNRALAGKARGPSLGGLHACGHCGKSDGNLVRCGNCKKVFYCSKDCQRTDWTSNHRSVCQKHTTA
jgi:hypothetical protein